MFTGVICPKGSAWVPFWNIRPNLNTKAIIEQIDNQIKGNSNVEEMMPSRLKHAQPECACSDGTHTGQRDVHQLMFSLQHLLHAHSSLSLMAMAARIA